MIPVLYEKNSTTFTTQGLGPLPDTIECTIHEARNGVYELEMRYPVTGLHYADIEIGNVIRARNAYCGLQPFDIYAISRPMNGVVTVNASHVSYRLNKKVLNPCSGSSAASAMASIGGHIMDGSDFLFWTDKTTVANWSATVPQSVRAALGGTEGSVLDVYGGEFEWDNFDVKLYGSRGTDTGIFIKYGKNLLDVVADENGAELFTACVPFFKARDDTVTIASVVKTAEWSADNNYTTVMDMGQYFEAPDGAEDNWHPTTAQMESKALALMNANAVSRIAQNLTVKFALLSQSDEYANLAALERVKLCDTVTVTHPGLGVDAKLKVIDTKWNVLLDRYDDIELGQPKASLSETIIGDLAETFAKMENELADKVDWTHMDAAIENATNLITGGDGGYIILGRNAAGEPNELFIMDTPDASTAVSVIRLNRNGIGFSTQGINGPYTNAWTIDGHLVADFIDTGVMDATIIKAGVLQDVTATNFWDLTTGEFRLTPNTIIRKEVTEGSDFWTVGAWGTDGTETTNNARLRSIRFPSNVVALKATNNYSFAIGAWVGTTYQGYLKTNGDIAQGTANLAWVTEFDVEEYRDKYPTYEYRALLRYTPSPSTAIDFDTASGSVYIVVDDNVDDYVGATVDSDLTQEEIYNRLTNNSANEGIYLSNGHLYLNASMMNAGQLNANLIKAGILQDSAGKNFWNMTTGEFQLTSGSKVIDGSSVMTIEDYIEGIASQDLTQEEIYNILTNDSANEGIYLYQGRLYLNASMMNTGVLKDSNSNTIFNLTTGALTMNKGSISLGSNSSDSNYYFHVSTTGALQWKSTYSEMTSDGQLACSRMIIMTSPQAVSNYGTYHIDIRGAVMKLVNSENETAWAVDPYGMKIYDLYGSEQGRILGRDQLRYTRNTSGLNLGSSARIVISSTNGLRFDDGSNGRIHIDNYNGKYGLIQDDYGLALFSRRTDAENCYIRVNPDGSISINSAGNVLVTGNLYENGYSVVTREDINVYSDGTIKWKEYD